MTAGESTGQNLGVALTASGRAWRRCMVGSRSLLPRRRNRIQDHRARQSTRPRPAHQSGQRGGGLTAPKAKSAPRHQSILVVDDALTIRELQRAILVRAGFDVRVATDGNHALARLAEAPSDLVLTDLQMPTWAAPR